jgi:hypothetical protein
LPFTKKTLTVDWVIDERDANNHIAYSFDFKTLDRRAVIDGKVVKKGTKKFPPEAAGGESYPIQIEISQELITIKDAEGNELDRYQRPDPSAPLGKFGFKGEVALKVTRK